MAETQGLPELPTDAVARSASEGVPGGTQAASASTPPTRRSRAWILIAVVVALVLCIGCAVAGLLAFRSGGESTTFGSFGQPTVGLVYLNGAIAGSGGVTPESFHRQFDAADKDPSVEAIVIRVESPGGTVAASQEIAAYVAAASKPVVVSVGDLCASGGYMVASQADRIVAMPGSSVGSIGVIMSIPNAEEALDKLGIEMQVITSGEHKDSGSVFRPLRDDERDIFQGEVDDIYEQFVTTVSEGRGMSADEVRRIATGRTYLGDQALEMGLIDDIGTLQDAGRIASELAGSEGEYRFRRFQQSPDLLTTLLSSGVLSPWGVLGDTARQAPAPQLR